MREEQRYEIFTHSDVSHLCCDHRFAGRVSSIVFSQRFPAASRGWKRIFRIYAGYVREWGVHGGVCEAEHRECFRRRSDVLSGGNRLVDRHAQGEGDRTYRIWLVVVGVDAGISRLDLWLAGSE